MSLYHNIDYFGDNTHTDVGLPCKQRGVWYPTHEGMC